MLRLFLPSFFFFNDTATTEIYTLSLHDALPISFGGERDGVGLAEASRRARDQRDPVAYPKVHPLSPLEARLDRKSTRLNSSHGYISYAVFCLKKKKKK